MRPIGVLLAAVVALAMVSAFTFTAPAVQAAPSVLAGPSSWAVKCAEGESNSEETATSRFGAPNNRQCINGLKLGTRGRIQSRVGCLQDRGYPGFVYEDPWCGSGGLPVEYIGQARAISYLNQHLSPSPPPRRVNADIQWELNIGGDRADILYYDRRNTTHVDIIEAKVSDNPDYPDWAGQLDSKYINPLIAAGMANVRRGQILDQWGEYRDTFEVKDDRPKDYAKCASGSPIVRTYDATTPHDGLLLIEENVEKRKCEDDSDDPNLPFKNRMKYEKPNQEPGEEPNQDTKKCPFDPICLDERVRFPSAVWGEPHLVTMDGLQYDLQSVGEFVLAESEMYDVEIQARFAARGDNVSVIDQVAMDVNEHRVELGGHELIVDGEPRTLASGETLHLGNRSGVIRLAATWYVVWDDGPIFRWDGGCCYASLGMIPGAPSDLTGLLGDGDGDPNNDLRLRGGTQLPATASETVLHGEFADSWRISDDESLFTYPAGKGTADYTDLTFPSTVVTLHDLSSEQMEAGSDYCQDHGVPPGPQFNACILDIALTSDASFATMAAAQKQVALDPLAAAVGANGSLAVNFEASPLPQNILPSRVSWDSFTTSFAGSFSGNDSYRAFVQQLPSHASGTLTFDLLALGDWNSDSDIETITVATDRAHPYTITPSTLTPVSTGTLASGVPAKIYRVTVPFTHTKSQAEFSFSSIGLAGLSSQGFGIDNLQINFALVPPQLFQTTLPFSVSKDIPAQGAGNIETEVSEDAYQFQVSGGRPLYLDVQSCLNDNVYLQWKLLKADGTAVTSGRCGDEQINGLAAGTYRLIVQSDLEATGE